MSARFLKFHFSIMHYELPLGVPAAPSGFPLYLFPLTLQKDAAPIPNA